MASRSVRAGETIKLRARFKDDLQQATEATDVFVHIFEPDEDTSNLANAFVVSGIPTYLGQGIFEYEFMTPACDSGGTWHDVWEGELACQDINAEFAFSVVDTGSFAALPCQLYDNDLVEVILPSGIMALDGSDLESPYSFEFMVTTSPSYTNVRKVRLEIGGFLGNIQDDTIQTAILEASLEADVLTFTTSVTNNNLFLHARREYTTCLASSMLLNNLGNLQLKSKTLADLSVSYDTNGIRDMLGKIQGCLEKWMPQLTSGGGARAASQPVMVVKGAFDPDRPAVGRLWESENNGFVIGSPTPAANIKLRNQNQRRYLKTHYPRGKRWW